MARQSILDTGKTPSWAGATPLLGAFGCPKNRGVAPAQGTECAFLFQCFCPRPGNRIAQQGGRICRSSTNDRNSLRESTRLEDIVVSTVEKYATFIESTPDHAS